VGQFGIVDIDFAAIGGYQTDDHVETGRLAGTVRAEQPTTSPDFTSKETSSTTVRAL
jgi:hypothetical protein